MLAHNGKIYLPTAQETLDRSAVLGTTLYTTVLCNAKAVKKDMTASCSCQDDARTNRSSDLQTFATGMRDSVQLARSSSKTDGRKEGEQIKVRQDSLARSLTELSAMMA